MILFCADFRADVLIFEKNSSSPLKSYLNNAIIYAGDETSSALLYYKDPTQKEYIYDS